LSRRWEEELHPTYEERKVYASKSNAAREGMRMLLEEGIDMRAMRADDWEFIVSQCDQAVVLDWQLRGAPDSPFSPLQLGLRARMDRYLEEYIREWKADRPTDGETLGLKLEPMPELAAEAGPVGGSLAAWRSGGGGLGGAPPAWGATRRLVRLSLCVAPSADAPARSIVRVGAAAGGACVALRLSFVQGVAVRAEAQPMPRFHRDGVTAGGGGGGGGGGGDGSGAIGVKEPHSGAHGANGAAEVGGGATAGDSAAGRRRPSPWPHVEAQLTASSAAAVTFRIRVCARGRGGGSGGGGGALDGVADPVLGAWDRGLDTNEPAEADALGMGYRYAQGPDGTRGFRLVRSAASQSA
jgi:hypothetical protein